MQDVIVRRSKDTEMEKYIDGKRLKVIFSSDKLECILTELEAGRGFEGPYRHKGEELHFILEGEIEYEIEGKKYLLQEGDCLWHKAILLHKVKNSGIENASFITITTPPIVI